MNIMVTGGLGVNGAWVTRQLLEQGHTPVVFENRMDATLVPDIIDKIDIVIGDIVDLATVIRAIKEHKVQRICHLAAMLPDAAQTNPMVGFQINALGTLNVLEAARIMEVERVVFISSIGVYAPFTGEYGYPTYKPVNEEYLKYPTSRLHGVYDTAKLASELMCMQYHQNYGLDFVAVRFGRIYGIGKKARHGYYVILETMIANAMLGKPTVIPSGGDEKSDLVYVKDVANGIVLACFAQNLKHRAFNIASGKGHKLEDIANALKKIYPEATFDIGAGLSESGYCVLDISRAKDELGYQPRFTLEEGMRDCVESMKRLNIEPVNSA